MAEKWTKTSCPPSTEMKPKPLSALNHLTVPCAMFLISPRGDVGAVPEPHEHRVATGVTPRVDSRGRRVHAHVSPASRQPCTHTLTHVLSKRRTTAEDGTTLGRPVTMVRVCR